MCFGLNSELTLYEFIKYILMGYGQNILNYEKKYAMQCCMRFSQKYLHFICVIMSTCLNLIPRGMY